MAVKDSASPVPNSEHENRSFDWSDVQLFMLVAQYGSLRSAGRRANRSVNSVRRRLQHLEHKLNRRLLVRDASGTHLTEHGRRLQAAGENMFEASLEVEQEFIEASRTRSHPVSIDIDETLANFWLMPLVVGYQHSTPQFQLDFRSATGGSGPNGTYCDVAVHTDRPSQNNLMVIRLGYLHFQPFASREFIKRHGRPKDLDDLENFSMVECSSAIAGHVKWSCLMPAASGKNVTVWTNSGSTHVAAVRHGAGIGLLPTYLTAFDDRLVPLLNGARCRRAIYLTYRRDAAEHRQVRSAIDWLISAFDTKQDPWFLEHYSAPDDRVD